MFFLNKTIQTLGIAAFFLSCSFTSSFSQQATSFELSLPSAILFALKNNPDVQMAVEREDQGYYSIEEIRAELYPQVKADASIGLQYNDPASGFNPATSDIRTKTEVSVAATQVLFDGFKILESIKEQEANNKSLSYETEVLTRDVILETVDAYLDILQGQKTLRAQERLVNRISDLVSKIELQFEVGAASKTELDYASSRLLFAQSQLTNVRSTVNDAESALESITGALPDFLAVEPEFLYAQKTSLKNYLDYMFKNNADFKANEYKKRALEHQYYAEESARYPSFVAELAGKQTTDDGGIAGMVREFEGSVSMKYQIFDGFLLDATQNRIRSQMRELHYNDLVLAKDLRRNVEQLYNQLESIEENLRLNAEEIATNEALQELNRKNFQSGSIDIIELIEGEERLLDSLSRKYGFVTDIYRNTYELLLIVGVLDKTYFCKSCK